MKVSTTENQKEDQTEFLCPGKGQGVRGWEMGGGPHPKEGALVKGESPGPLLWVQSIRSNVQIIYRPEFLVT